MIENVESNMETWIDDEGQQLDKNYPYKIPRIDIELKEKQFMHDDLEYYKEVKIKSKKNSHAENKKPKFSR